MLLAEARERIRQSMFGNANTFDALTIDRALLMAGNEFVRRTRCTTTQDTVTVTDNDPEVDLSPLADFRPERMTRIEIAYNDRGTWATSTAYSVNDLVQGDGSPDTLLYRCVSAHTSDGTNEPPNDTYWAQVQWKRGPEVSVSDYDSIADMLSGRSYVALPSIAVTTPGQPRSIGFLTSGTAYVYPVPDAAYILSVIYYQPFTDWQLGTEMAVTLNIPDEYINPVLFYGAPALLESPDPTISRSSARFQQFEIEIDKLSGAIGNYSSGYWKNPIDYC